MSHSLLWMSAVTLVSALPSVPLEYYYTFVIEERHGFNKSTKKLWVTDQLKQWTLIAVLGLPILAGFLKVIEYAGKAFVPYLLIFLFSIQILLQLIFPTVIQPLFNKVEPLPAGELREKVEALASQLKFPLTDLSVIDGSKRSGHSNAYFYGMPWSKHIVIYDTLIEQSTPTEVEAVVGHELGHWSHCESSRLRLGVMQHADPSSHHEATFGVADTVAGHPHNVRRLHPQPVAVRLVRIQPRLGQGQRPKLDSHRLHALPDDPGPS